jgi:serine/threonine-protein kinase RIO1
MFFSVSTGKEANVYYAGKFQSLFKALLMSRDTFLSLAHRRRIIPRAKYKRAPKLHRAESFVLRVRAAAVLT